jgi:hypothetical protein
MKERPRSTPSARGRCLAVLGVLALALTAAPLAHAERTLLGPLGLKTEETPGGQIEGACGVAVSGATIYISDYYHHGIDLFDLNGKKYQGQIPGNPLDGPCGLALSSTGALYANDWHQSVSRVRPSLLRFDSAESTGVAVATNDNVYVNDRDHIAVYEPSGAFVMNIGEGSLEDGYGVAVRDPARVYVPDAADDTIKVYEPGTDPDNPAFVITGVGTPQGGFSSLVDAAVAIDPSNAHLIVVDNLQPGFEHPEAAIDEFDATGAYLGQLQTRVVAGEPTGVAFGGGKLYVTTGNSEGANVLAFGPYQAALPGLGALRSPVVQEVAPSAVTADGVASSSAPAQGPLGVSSSTRRSRRAAAARRRQARQHRAAKSDLRRLATKKPTRRAP